MTKDIFDILGNLIGCVAMTWFMICMGALVLVWNDSPAVAKYEVEEGIYVLPIMGCLTYNPEHDEMEALAAYEYCINTYHN